MQRETAMEVAAAESQRSAGSATPSLEAYYRGRRIQAVPQAKRLTGRRTARSTHTVGPQANKEQPFYFSAEVTGTDDRPAKQGAADILLF